MGGLGRERTWSRVSRMVGVGVGLGWAVRVAGWSAWGVAGVWVLWSGVWGSWAVGVGVDAGGAAFPPVVDW